MALLTEQRVKIKTHVINKVREKLSKYNPETNKMPFHYRLLGKNRVATFSFVHSINTTLGASIFEQVAAIIVEPHAQKTIAQYKNFEGFISSKTVLLIDDIIRDLRSAEKRPDKCKETQAILETVSQGNKGKKLKKRVDLFVKMKDGIEYYFEIKTAKPNIQAFTSIKRQMLDWVAMRMSEDPSVNVKTLVAIPYNPYEPRPYERWTLQGLFDIKEEILVGAEFWDFLGGEGTYEALLDIFQEVGLLLHEEIEHKICSIGNQK